MTTLYKPVPIESAEQANALPDATVAICDREFAREKVGYRHPWADTDGNDFHDIDMIGWLALVPIEAEEETLVDSGLRGCETAQDYMDYLDGKRVRTMTRYVTPWEES